jgi:hypothetical protein
LPEQLLPVRASALVIGSINLFFQGLAPILRPSFLVNLRASHSGLSGKFSTEPQRRVSLPQ